MHSGKTCPKASQSNVRCIKAIDCVVGPSTLMRVEKKDSSRPIASAVWSIKAHMRVSELVSLRLGRKSLSVWGWPTFEDFQNLIYQTFFALVLEHPENCLAMPSGHLCATRGLPSRHLSIAIDSLTQVNLLAASFCDKKTQPTSNKNCSGSSQTKLQTSIPCGRGIWCLTHGNPHEGKHDTPTCSFTLDNRPARCSFMLQVCNLCILRNRYSRFRPVRILLHCTRLNTEHLSGAFAHAGGQDNHNLFSGQTLKQILECWTVHTTKAFFQDSSGIFELFGDSTTPEYSGPLFSKVTNKEGAAFSWNFAIQGLSKELQSNLSPQAIWWPSITSGHKPVLSVKKHKNNLDQSGDTRKISDLL